MDLHVNDLHMEIEVHKISYTAIVYAWNNAGKED